MLSPRVAARIAWSLWAVSIPLAAAGSVLLVLTRSVETPSSGPFRGWGAILAAAAATVGAFIASRRPGNAIGWLFCALGLVGAIEHLSREYTYFAVLAHPGQLPAGEFSAWVYQQIGIFDFMSLVFLLLLFPEGRVLSKTWRPALGLAIAAFVLAFVGSSLRPGPMSEFSILDNPYAAGGRVGAVMAGAEGIGLSAASASLLIAAVSLVLRFRRSRGVEREQLKWLVYSATLVGLSFVGFIVVEASRKGAGLFAGPIAPASRVFTTLVFLGFALAPVSAGIAILRYHLYDIDRIISRTLSYAIVTAFLGGAFALVVLVPTSIAGAGGQVPDWLVAIATLVVAALFRPVRRRVQNVVDHRFNRARYDIARTIETFAVRLRDEVDMPTLKADLEALVRQTMAPAHVSLWLREELMPNR